MAENLSADVQRSSFCSGLSHDDFLYGGIGRRTITLHVYNKQDFTEMSIYTKTVDVDVEYGHRVLQWNTHWMSTVSPFHKWWNEKSVEPPPPLSRIHWKPSRRTNGFRGKRQLAPLENCITHLNSEVSKGPFTLQIPADQARYTKILRKSLRALQLQRSEIWKPQSFHWNKSPKQRMGWTCMEK